MLANVTPHVTQSQNVPYKTTITMGQDVQMFTHSDVNKSICRRQTNWYRFSQQVRELLISRLFFERVSNDIRRGGTCTCNQVKTGWNTEGVIMNIECERVLHSSRRLLVDPPTSREDYKWEACYKWILRAKNLLANRMSTHFSKTMNRT